MFNLSGSEIVFLLIIGLVVLGPEKLPTALRKAGRLYGEFRRITSGAESDFRSAFAEPLRELKDTASSYKTMFTDAAGGITDAATDVKSSFMAFANPGQILSSDTPPPTTVNETSLANGETANGETANGESKVVPDDPPSAVKADGTDDIVDGM